MLKIDRTQKKLQRVENPSLGGAGLRERYDLQQMIARSPDAFFTEIGEELLLLGQEIRPSDVVDDRIDLLALDVHGAAVVIELKRGSNKLQLLQAISYAAMIAEWTPERLVALRREFAGVTVEQANESVEQFLKEDVDAVNQRQRLILVAEDFDYSVLASAEWLSEKYGVDVRCFKLVVTIDEPNEYIGCVRIFPQSDLAQEAVSRRATSGGVAPTVWRNWDDAIAAMDNPAMADFFRQQIQSGKQHYLRKRLVRFFVADRWRWSVSAKTDRAYVWQNGRFEGDVEFWRSRLSVPDDVVPVKLDKSLRLRLRTAKDFANFVRAAEIESSSMRFLMDHAGDDEEPSQ